MKNLGFKTPYQARQAVVHGHVMIGDRVVTIPSYTVDVNEEKDVRLLPNSAYIKILEESKEEAPAAEVISEETVEAQPEVEEKPTEESSQEKPAE